MTFVIKMKMKIVIDLAMACFFFFFYVAVADRVKLFSANGRKQERMIISGLLGWFLLSLSLCLQQRLDCLVPSALKKVPGKYSYCS